MTKLSTYLNALKQAGHRLTPQRQIICAYLAETDSHPTPYQVYADLTQDHPEISRATVYNTLNVLQELGVITEIAFGADHTHYETNPAPHVNLICLRCHRIVDYHEVPALEGLHSAVQEMHGFQVVSTKIELLGFCRECRERKRAEIVAQWSAQHMPADAAAGSDPM